MTRSGQVTHRLAAVLTAVVLVGGVAHLHAHHGAVAQGAAAHGSPRSFDSHPEQPLHAESFRTETVLECLGRVGR
ncbi:MAG: hypothetical protein VYE73_01835 [Acidobacteriota bacterium]|nr:hypothetical protein [Acidobacteriota bacterium]